MEASATTAEAMAADAGERSGGDASASASDKDTSDLDLYEDDFEESDEGVEARKWTVSEVSWQQKIYDSATIEAATKSTRELEIHLRNLFGMPKANGGSPEKERGFQEVCQRYKDEIVSLRSSAVAEADSEDSSGKMDREIYTYVDYEDSVRQAITNDAGEVSQEAITTAAEGPEYSLNCGLSLGGTCQPQLADGLGARKKKTRGGQSHRLQQTKDKRAQSMTVVLGLNGEQIVLAQMRFFQNGILEIRPGFSDSSSNSGKTTVFLAETPKGALIEYTLENASAPLAQNEVIRSMFGLSLSQKEKKAGGPNPAMTVKKAGLGGPFVSLNDRYGLNGGTASFAIMLEIVGGKNFRRDNLYVEYFVHLPRAKGSFEPKTPAPGKATIDEIWQVTEDCRRFVQGITQVSAQTRYPTQSFFESGRHKDKVLNWSFPVELELTVSKELTKMEEKEWPVVIFTVYSYDRWNRSTCEGFCRLQLSPENLGSKCHYLDTWKPLGSLKQQMKESFTGGIVQPQDMHGLYDYLINQKLDSPMVTSCEGTLKIRTNMVLQKQVENVRMSRNLTRSMNFTPSVARPKAKGLKAKSKAVAAKVQSHTLLEITERARERIRVLREKNNKMNLNA